MDPEEAFSASAMVTRLGGKRDRTGWGGAKGGGFKAGGVGVLDRIFRLDEVCPRPPWSSGSGGTVAPCLGRLLTKRYKGGGAQPTI